MAEFIEGEWKNFIFKFVTEDNYPEISEGLKEVFCKDEPLNQLVGYSDEFSAGLTKSVLASLDKKEGLSFYAEDKETGKLAAFRLTTCEKRKEEKESEPEVGPTDPKFNKIKTVLKAVAEKGDVFNKYNVDNYGYFCLTWVHPDFRGKGLVTEVYKRSISHLRAKGFPVCAGLFSSPHTRKAAKNLGFETLAMLYFVDFKDEKGNPLLPGATPDQGMSCMALRLN